MITTKTLFYRVITGGTALHLYTGNQLFFLPCRKSSIRCILLPELPSFLTGSWPMSIFLALETPHGTTDTCHWHRLDTTTVFCITSLGGVLNCCCIDNQLAPVCRAPFPFGAHLQHGVHPLCQKPFKQRWCKGHQGNIINCYATLMPRAPQFHLAQINLGLQMDFPTTVTELMTTAIQGQKWNDAIMLWNTTFSWFSRPDHII